MTSPIAHIKTIFYLWISKWFIKLNRIFAPLQAVMIFSKRVNHLLHLCLGCFYPVQNQPQDYQKAVECMMFWWRKIQTMSYRLTIWSVIPERVTYAYTRPVPDRDAKSLLEVNSRFSLFETSPNSGISPDKTCHESNE